MPITYEIDKKQGVVRMRGWGLVTNEDLVSSITRLRSDPDLAYGMPTLSDIRDVEDLQISFQGHGAAVRISEETNEQRGPAKAAIVVRNDAQRREAEILRTVFSHYNASPTFEIFQDLDAARAYLGLR